MDPNSRLAASAAARLNLAGAVTLDPKPASPPPAADSAPPAAAGASVVDVTEASFQADVVERSATVPVVIDFWADWCGPCKQLSPVLEKLAGEGNGTWVLAKIDVDANPRLAQAAQVQGIPAVKAVVGGQIVAEFTGALPEAQVRQWVSELVRVAGGMLRGEPGEAPLDPTVEAADEALTRGDLDAAAQGYRDRLAEAPADTMAAEGLARVELLQRAQVVDPEPLQQRLQADPTDVDAATALADLAVASGQVGPGLALLVDLVKRTSGDQRDAARAHLLALFTALGDDDPDVPAARRALAAALF